MKIVRKKEESGDARKEWRLRLGEREHSAGSSQGAADAGDSLPLMFCRTHPGRACLPLESSMGKLGCD